jgi:hypothetical protein
MIMSKRARLPADVPRTPLPRSPSCQLVGVESLTSPYQCVAQALVLIKSKLTCPAPVPIGYYQDQARGALASQSIDHEEFLRGLQMRAVVEPIAERNLPRAVQPHQQDQSVQPDCTTHDGGRGREPDAARRRLDVDGAAG